MATPPPRREDEDRSIISPRTGNRYIVGDTLASGGYGKVYRGELELSGGGSRPVAIKVFSTQGGSPPVWLQQSWQSENELMIQLEHPFIVDRIDSLIHKGYPVIVYELALCSLGDVLNRGQRFAPKYVIRRGYQLLHALRYIHQRNVLHRDITPNNILLFPGGGLKLADFGISKQLQGGEEIARTLFFNRPFVVPELLQRGYTSAQSDFYQFGLVLYGMLAGRPAIQPNLPWDSIRSLINSGTPQQLAHQLPRYGVPLGLSLILESLLRVDVRYRYHNVQKILIDFVHLAIAMNLELDPPPDPSITAVEPMPWPSVLLDPETHDWEG